MLTPEEEYEEIGERLNDIDSHIGYFGYNYPERLQIIARLRELESIVHPTGEDDE